MVSRVTKQQRSYGARRIEPAVPRLRTGPQTFRGELSVRRNVFREGAAQLDKVLANVPKRNVRSRHAGRWALFVPGPQEYRPAAAVSPLRGFYDLKHVGQELSESLAGFMDAPVSAEVTGLVQRKNWFGAELMYETYDEERSLITGALNRIFDVNHDWPTSGPFIRIAEGNLNDLTNRDKLENTLPARVNLLPAWQVPAVP